MSSWKKTLTKYVVTVAVAAGMVLLTLNLHGFSELTGRKEQILLLANAFTIPGVILVMLGFLVMVANGGFFNGVAYAVTYAVRLLIPGPNKGGERYGDYVERKRAAGKVKGYGFLFITGVVFVLIAVVFTVLFYTV